MTAVDHDTRHHDHDYCNAWLSLVLFVRRALAAGRRDARGPLIVAVALAALFLAQNLLSFVVGLFVVGLFE